MNKVSKMSNMSTVRRVSKVSTVSTASQKAWHDSPLSPYVTIPAPNRHDGDVLINVA